MTDVAALGFKVDTSQLVTATAKLDAISTAGNKAAVSAKAVGDAAEGAGKKISRFSTGNIAAQFHDIAVTSAMGTNPLTIALQQGTQLSAVLQTMESPLSGIASGIKEVFNATSLLTIGLVAALAVGLEFVNWIKVGDMLTNGLAASVKYLGPVFLGLAIAMAVIKWQAMYNSITSIIKLLPTLATAMAAVSTAAAAMWAFITAPVTLIVAGITAIVAVLGYLSGAFDKASQAVKTYVGNLIGVGRYSKEFRTAVAEQIDDLLIQQRTLNMSKSDALQFRVQQELLNKAVKDFNGKPTVEQFKSLQQSAEAAASGVSATARGLEELQSKKDMGDLNKDTDDRIARLKLEVQGLNMTSEAADRLTIQYDLLKAAQDKGIQPKDIDLGKISAAASQIAHLQEQLRKGNEKDPFDAIVNNAEKKINTYKEQADALGKTAQQADYLKARTDLLNEAIQKNIDLTPQQTEQIEKLAQGMAASQAHAKSMTEAFNFMKDASEGFFSDLRQGLSDGKSLWESFGNAVNNVINKIIDKLLNTGIEQLLGGLFGSGGSGSGLLETISKTLFNAKGNAFDAGGVTQFAKGGSFSNSIVSKPTMFQFAHGGAMGEMGEAGPEAVMPLHRGPDGSLGVRSAANDNGGNGGVIINIINNGNSKVSTQQKQTSQGMQIDVIIDQTVSQKINQQGSETNRSLKTYNNRQLIQR